AVLFHDGFENGFSNWTTLAGTPATSKVRAHNGRNSFAVSQNQQAIQYSLGSNSNQVAAVWFYDDASDS
ncbi:MAG: hypothetical protein J7639_16610, partial [Paenibacillaceae bacterium]|nr:hypothetical protein [Paenibacillaceae bacterium]